MKKMFILSTVLLLFAVLLLTGVVPTSADNPPAQPPSDTSIIPPLNDPSQAIYNSPTINNLSDPNNPNYNPTLIYGPEGKHVGTPSEKWNPIIPKMNGRSAPMDDHQNWGTYIPYNSNIYGQYGYQAVFNDINLNENGDWLYAPVMIAPNQCPWEMVTLYKGVGTTPTVTERYLTLRDWDTGLFPVNISIDSTFLSNYVRSGSYIGELLYSSGQWHAYLYNWNSSTWVGIGTWENPQTGQTGGWDMWEEYNLSNNWPTLPTIWSNYLTVKVGTGNDWQRVISTYGGDGGMTMTSLYPHYFNNQYYYWQVGPGPQ